MEATIDKRKKNGGARKGSGRKRGVKSKHTLANLKTREQALELFQQRAFKMTNKLLDAQSIVAMGTHKMIAVTKDAEGKTHVETIRDEKRMQEFLDTGTYGIHYMIVEGSAPDFRAADAILNRALGKPTESIELTGKGGQPMIIKLDN